MRYVQKLLHSKASSVAVALVAVVGLAFACSESPTATNKAAAPRLAKPSCPGHPSCDDDPPPPSTITATLIDPAGAGVVSDGLGPYAGANVTDRFKLAPQCGDRTMSLSLDVTTPVPELVNQSTCNDDGPQGGWVFFRLPDLFDITANCGPGEGPGGTDTECFPPIPSFTTNKNGKVRATGAFAPNAQYFVQDLDSGERFEFLFQNGHVVVGEDDDGNPTWQFTATEAHLYIGHQFVCVGDDQSEEATEEENLGRCDDFPLKVNITVTR